ncbi:MULTISPECIES: DUF6708 domain-containing protein [Ralstonia]|uniref:DUF6708 domain-containing protein n=2 Tax=Bacteria TaxID=2 RepID=A0A9Q3QQ64_RALPI|nr:DUF6708 domain-containing protein [Ralstonia pickettii]MBA9848083.1 hypothetical protein [Ralstonia pickettii]MBA9853594.1 hypothetical protein [Ralstonia pickettii]MBA9879614.1 hypothetical protein [Ralstonia pickettii]MBA9884629.1 hypothetical protein [Ralstonia pickettii]MBA9889719.1 hypothetical protein [Ralstonia pickettii]
MIKISFPSKDERLPQSIYAKQKGKPLGEWEMQNRLYIDQPALERAEELGNVYRIDSTYLEIIDDAQDQIQIIGLGGIFFLAFTALALAWSGMWISGPFTQSAEVVAQSGYWFWTILGAITGLAVAVVFGALDYKVMRRNLFTLKRRPIRLNRKTRRIYAIRTKDPDGIWEVPWSNDEFFCIGKRKVGGLKRAYDMYDVRHYTLDAQGNVVRAFVLGQMVFTVKQAQLQWEYFRRYMQDGPANLPEPRRFWAPRESFWEGYRICRRDKFPELFEQLSDLILWPFGLLEATCRWLILVTCSDPVWPAEIEAACKPEPNDPYARPYADDFVGFASGPYGQPSRSDIDRMLALEKYRRREGALTRAEAEALIRKQAEVGA